MEPAHPGAILREEVLPALGISITAAARRLRVSRQSLHAILAERSSGISRDGRSPRFCGNGEPWLRMQSAHDLWHAERKLRHEVEKISTIADLS